MASLCLCDGKTGYEKTRSAFAEWLCCCQLKCTGKGSPSWASQRDPDCSIPFAPCGTGPTTDCASCGSPTACGDQVTAVRQRPGCKRHVSLPLLVVVLFFFFPYEAIDTVAKITQITPFIMGEIVESSSSK